MFFFDSGSLGGCLCRQLHTCFGFWVSWVVFVPTVTHLFGFLGHLRGVCADSYTLLLVSLSLGLDLG